MVHKMYLTMLTNGVLSTFISGGLSGNPSPTCGVFLAGERIRLVYALPITIPIVATTVTVIKLAVVLMPNDRCVTHEEYKQAAVLIPNAG
jgi:hypothetical protein